MQERKSLFRKVLFTLVSVFILSSLAAPFLVRADTTDTTPPEVAYGFQTPQNGAVVSGTITIDGNFNDNGGLGYIAMAVDDVMFCDFGLNPESGYKECSVDTTTLANGEHAIIYVAINQAGLITSLYDRVITVVNQEPADTTAPIFALKDVTRDENEFAPSYAEFVQSNPEGLAPVCSGLESANLYVAQPSANKLVPVTCSVTDDAGNTTTATANLIVNNVQPQVIIIANPDTSVTAGNTITLIANILHGNGSFTYSWTGACYGSGTGSQNTVGLTNTVSANYSAGSYLCGITVTDSDGDVSAASVELNFSSNSQNTTTTTDTSTDTTTPETTPVEETPAEVEGTSTEQTPEAEAETSAPQEPTQETNSTNETNTNTTNSTTTNTTSSSTSTSPLVIICLVAGGILIIGLLLFLFFRGEDDEEVTTAV